MNSPGRYALNGIAAILVFVFVCAGLGALFPRQVSGISLKLRRFKAQKKQFDIIFIGSSRIYHGVSPKAFDDTLLRAGRRWRSFNAAMDGMNPAEEFAFTRRLLALHPPKLKYIFFEFQSDPGAGTPTRDDWVSERDVYWRDRDSLMAGFRKFAIGLSSPGNAFPGDRFSLGRLSYFGPLLSADTRLWARNMTNFGEGFEIVERAVGALPLRADDNQLPPNWDGFFPMAGPMSGEALTDYRKVSKDLQEHPVKRLPDAIMRSELSRFSHAMAAKNIQVIFVLPPALIGNRGAAIDAPPGNLLLTYDDRVRYTQFYDEENRLDTQHLNARGADLFSRTLATDFGETLRSAIR
jgi:hypothetical protein